MTEPGFVAPTPTGWWARKDRVGINENETEWVTTTAGATPQITYKGALRIAHPRVGPQAMRRNFRRKPRAQYVVPVPEFDSLGGGAKSSGTSWSWSHTIGSNAKAIIVVGSAVSTAGWPIFSGTVGGVALDVLGHQYHGYDGTYFYSTFILGMLNPPTGTQTVAVSSTTSSAATGMNSLAYSNVAAFDEPIYQPMSGVDGSTTNYVALVANAGTMTAPAAKANQLFVGGFNPIAATTAWSSVTPNQRFNNTWSSGQNFPLIVGDARNGQTLTATYGASGNYGAVGIQLSPTAMPSFGAMGAGANAAPGNISWSHTAKAGDYVLAGVLAQYPGTAPTCTGVTYGSTSMTLLGSIAMNNANTNGVLWIYGLAGVSAGTYTITPTITTGSTFYQTGNSISIHNASTATFSSTMYGTGSGAKTLATTCNPDQLIVFFGGAEAYANATISAPTGGITRYFKVANPNLDISTASTPTTFGYTVNSDNYGACYVVMST